MVTRHRNVVIQELADVLDSAMQNRAQIQLFTLFPTSQPATNKQISNLETEVYPTVNEILHMLGGVAVPIQSPKGRQVGSLLLTSWLGFDSEDYSYTNWHAKPLNTPRQQTQLVLLRCILLETIADMRTHYPLSSGK